MCLFILGAQIYDISLTILNMSHVFEIY
jgi:hypothetical protein